jgi:hypothetical protein
MMSIRDLEELDDSLQAMGVSNMDALQRAKALLDTAASKKKKANQQEEQEPSDHNSNPDFHHYINQYRDSSEHNYCVDDNKYDEKDQEYQGGAEDNHECAVVDEKFNDMFIWNSPHAIQDLNFHSPMQDIWERRLDDLSSPSVSLATISEDEEHGSDDEEESFDPHERFFKRMSMEDEHNRVMNGNTNSNELDDDDLSIDTMDNDALMQRLKLLENTKMSLLNQCSYLESKLERKTSKLIRVEEQKKELKLRLDRIEAENRDDMKDVMRKMNQMEISYQQRIAIQDARIQQLEIELKEIKQDKASNGSETSNESNCSSEINATTDTLSSLSTTMKHKRNWLMHLK